MPNKSLREPRLRVLHEVSILSGCRDSRGHLNSTVRCFLESTKRSLFLYGILGNTTRSKSKGKISTNETQTHEIQSLIRTKKTTA